MASHAHLRAGIAVLALAATIGVSAQPALPIEGALPGFAGATAWLNSAPLALPALRGKVVLVDFWTYTCINWQRTQAHVRAWAQRYRDEGLVVVGVHTPEFGFEKDLANIERALPRFGVDYPVAVDSNAAIWEAFRNRYWPAIYIADGNGMIRYHQFGEGEYERTEEVIRQLLRERGAPGVGNANVRVEPRGSEVEANWSSLASPETYLGHAQATGFAGKVVAGRTQQYSLPRSLRLNQWALAGGWTIDPGAIVLDQPQGRIAFRFHARDVHLVMRPRVQGATIRFRIRIDGKPPGDAHGTDTDADGRGTIDDARLYQLVRQTASVHDRTFEIEFLDAGVEAYVFTFG